MLDSLRLISKQEPSLFNKLITIEKEATRVLDLRERLRVEEIFLEMQIDVEQLYVKRSTYQAALALLGNVRILIVRSCSSLTYIQDECTTRGLLLDVGAVDKRRIASRPPNHPFYTVLPYLKPSATKDFHNFEQFEQSNLRVGHLSWDEMMVEGHVESSSNDSSEPSTSSDTHSLSFGRDEHDSPIAAKFESLDETASQYSIIEYDQSAEEVCDYTSSMYVSLLIKIFRSHD